MNHFTWRDVDCLIVTAVEPGRCSGCVFRNTSDDECPHTDGGVSVSCEAPGNDIIYIEDTPKAIAEYAMRRLGGT
jgi:hypothetical protein